MNGQTAQLLVPVISGLASLIFEMIENWQNKEYKPVVSQDLQKSIDVLRSLPDLPEE